jgi:hypothetical protein
LLIHKTGADALHPKLNAELWLRRLATCGLPH